MPGVGLILDPPVMPGDDAIEQFRLLRITILWPQPAFHLTQEGFANLLLYPIEIGVRTRKSKVAPMY